MIDYTMTTGGVYVLTNIINNMIYIGSTQCFGERWYKHFEYPHLNSCRKLKHAIMKYGKDAFTATVLIELPINRALLIENEQRFLDELQPFGTRGYNIRRVAGSNLGIKHTDETRKIWSEIKQGTRNPMWGKKQAPESIEQGANKRRGQVRTMEQREKMGEHRSIPVIAYYKDGTIYKQFSSMAEAIDEINGDYTSMKRCLLKQPNYKTHKGFIWKYANHSDVVDVSCTPNDL